MVDKILDRASGIFQKWGWGKRNSVSEETSRSDPGVRGQLETDPMETVLASGGSPGDILEATFQDDPLSLSKVGDFSSTRRSMHTTQLDTAIVDDDSLKEHNVDNETLEGEMLLAENANHSLGVYLDYLEDYFSPRSQDVQQNVSESKKKGKKQLKKSLATNLMDKQLDSELFQKPEVPPPKPKRTPRQRRNSKIVSPIRSRSGSQKRKQVDDDLQLELGKCTCVTHPDFVCPIYEHGLPPDKEEDKESISSKISLDSKCDIDDYILVGKGGKPAKSSTKKPRKK